MSEAKKRTTMSWFRLAATFAIASLVSTVLITVATIFFYEGRGFVFGDDSWAPGAWSYARVETYEQRLVANLAFVGFPVALCTLLLAMRLRTASRGLRIFAAVAPSLLTMVPAWWLASWSGPSLLALLVGLVSASTGAGIFLLSAHAVGYTRAAPATPALR